MLGVLAEPVLATKFPSTRIRTAVMGAIHLGNTKTLATVLAKNGLDVNSILMRGGYTVLHEAALAGAPEVVRYLIEHGADVNVTDDDGWTPLDTATSFDKTEVAVLLKQVGAIDGDGFRIKAAPTLLLIGDGNEQPNGPAAGDYVFMAAFTDSFQGPLMANFSARTSARTAAVMTEEGDAYSEGLSQVFH